MNLYSRNNWVLNSSFEGLSGPQTLKKVSDFVRTSRSPCSIIFDLDSTLYQVQSRTFAILKSWQADPSLKSLLDLGELTVETIGYSLSDTLKTLQIKKTAAFEGSIYPKLKTFWKDRFFSEEFLHHDQAYPNAVAYVRHLWDLGATIFYLTGRDLPNMGKTTFANLKRDGFPIEKERTSLKLKPDSSVSDLSFKVLSLKKIATEIPIAASFENEPSNLVEMQAAVPDAHHVFVDTIYSDHPAPAVKGVYRIKGFEGFDLS